MELKESIEENSHLYKGEGTKQKIEEEGDEVGWEEHRRDSSKQKAGQQFWIFTIFSLILTSATVINYRSMRQQCPDFTEHECLVFIKSNLHHWLTLIFINSVFSVIQIFLFWHKKGSRAITVIGVVQIFYLFINTEQNLSTTKYIGAINFFHIVFIAGILTIIGIIILFVKICSKKPKPTLVITLIFACLIGTVIYSRIKTSCDFWDKGISGRIEDIPGRCKITNPQICWFSVLNGFFDLSFFLRDCHLSTSDRQNFKKYFHKAMLNGSFVGFASPTNFDENKRRYYDVYKEVYSFSKGFKSFEEARESPEAFDIIFDAENQKYHIDVRRNETLVKQRTELRKKHKENSPLATNVLLIYTDAIGRASMHFKFPKITSFFKERAREKSYLQEKASEGAEKGDQAYQFYRYNSYYPWTVPNQNRMYYENVPEDANLEVPLKESVFRKFQEKGFILGTSATVCQIMSMAYFREDLMTAHFDHELFSYACDPNFQDPENVDNFFQGPYSIGKHCLYGKIMAEYATDAALSFFRTYKDQPKVFSLQFVEGHEGSGDVIDYIDVPIANLLETLQKEGMLQDTIVMLYSDHGYHMHGALHLINPQNVNVEVGLPGMMVSLPFSTNQLYRKRIALNQQAVVSAYNIFYFLAHIAQGQQFENQDKGLLGSLVDQTCAKLNITEYECKCKSY